MNRSTQAENDPIAIIVGNAGGTEGDSILSLLRSRFPDRSSAEMNAALRETAALMEYLDAVRRWESHDLMVAALEMAARRNRNARATGLLAALRPGAP